MAECKEKSQECSSANDNKTTESKHNNTKNGLHNGVGKKLVEEKEFIPHHGNSVVTQEKNKILLTTTELQEVIINILQQKLKLSHIRNKNFMNALSTAVEDVQKAADEAVKGYLDNSGEKKLPEFQVIMEFLDGIKIEQEKYFLVNAEKFLVECHRMFMNYEEIYKKSNILLSDFLKNVEKVLKTNEMPRNSELQECVLFSIFKEKLVSYNRILTSSEKAFSEFESLLKNDLQIPEQGIEKTIDLLLTRFNKAEFAFGMLKKLAVEALKIDCAEV